MTPNALIHSKPDLSVSTATRVPCVDELRPLDRQGGWLFVNRWNHRLLRRMAAMFMPKPDLTGVSMMELPEAGRRSLMVIPDEPKGKGAVFLIHGGGYVIGRPEEILSLAIDYAQQLGVPVMCPSYQLAPEAPFPAGLNDLSDAWHWLQSNAADHGIDPAKVIVAGQSAGGGLAAALVQRLHDEGGVQPAGQVLIYPMLDDRTATRRALDRPRHRVWSNRSNLFGWTSYLGHAPGRDPKPYAVPGRQVSVAGLPPAWIGVGTSDLFLDENRAYAALLETQDVPVTYAEVPGAIHGFEAAGTPLGKAFIGSQVAFMAPRVT